MSRGRVLWDRQGISLFKQIAEAAKAAPQTGCASDTRAATRRRVFLQTGKVFDVAGRLIAEAHLRDISQFGLQLVLDRKIDLPKSFRVQVDHSGSLVLCTAVWRREHVVGARVLSPDHLWLKAAQVSTDRRASPRRRVHMQSVKIFTETGSLLGEGQLRDISENGMKIVLPNVRQLPARFRVHIEHNLTFATCALVWRRERLVGVRIV